MKIPERYFPIFILIFCGLIFLPHLGVLPVNIMEARNFISAREMVTDGHWILTTLNGEPRYEKPPLPTWLTAMSGMIFGLDKVAALRFPAVFMALLASWFTYALGKRITGNPNYALLGVLVLTTSFFFTWAGRNGQWDIFTHAFMMGAIYFMVLWWTEAKKKILYALLGGVFVGFSFLSKGPVSLYALLLPFLIAFGMVYRFGNTSRKSPRKRLGPFLVFMVTALTLSSWWHLYIYFFDTRAAQEITSREISNWNSYNIRPFYYYWNFFIQSGTWTIVAFAGLLYPYLRSRVSDKKAYTFTFIWTLASVILLSLIPEKKSRYLLPVLIPLAMNTAFYLGYIFRASRRRKLTTLEKIPVWLQFGIVGLTGLATPIGGYVVFGEQLQSSWLWFILLSITLAVLGVAIFWSLRKNAFRSAFNLTLGFMVALVVFGLPLSGAFTDNPAYQNSAELQSQLNLQNMPVYEFDKASPEIIWDFGGPLPIWKKDIHGVQGSFGLLAMESSQEKVEEHFPGYSVQKLGYIDLNPRGREQGGHKSRLYRDFYLITRE